RHRLGREDTGGDNVYAIVVATFCDEADVRGQHVATGPAPGGIVRAVAGVITFVPIVVVGVVIIIAPPKLVVVINWVAIIIIALLYLGLGDSFGIRITAWVHRITMAEPDQYAVDGPRLGFEQLVDVQRKTIFAVQVYALVGIERYGLLHHGSGYAPQFVIAVVRLLEILRYVVFKNFHDGHVNRP